MPKWICPCCGAEYHGWAGYYKPSPCCGAELIRPEEVAPAALRLHGERESP